MTTQSNVLDRIIDKGLTLSFESADLCCPDCLQQIVSAAVPASPMLTTHEVNIDNYRIYFLASVETSLKIFEFLGLTASAAVPASPLTYVNPDLKVDCCIHYEASVETALKLAESFSFDISNNLKSCSTNFNSCIDDLFNSFTSQDIDRILEKGLVEYGSISGESKVCMVKTFVDLTYNSQDRILLSKGEILDRILDKGIVVSCYNGEMSISSGETFQKWYDTYIKGAPAAPPA